MSFLTPLYLLAGLAVLAPVLAHLVRKRPREVMEFSSVIFIEQAAPRLTNRNRLDHWLLLALRSLIVLSLAFAFARPYLKTMVEQPSRQKAGKQRVLLVDTSASMRRDGLWEKAIQKAQDYISQCDPEDSIAVYSMTDRIEAIQSLEQAIKNPASSGRSVAAKSLVNLSPTWYPSDIGKAMLQGLELLKVQEQESEIRKPSELAIVSDFQQGNSLESLGSVQWPTDIPVIPLICQPEAGGNATLWILAVDSQAKQLNSEVFERVAVRNDANSKTDRFKLQWLAPDGARLSTEAIEVTVPAGQQQIVAVARPRIDSLQEDSPLILELQGDSQPFDNRQYLYRGPKESAQAVCIDSQAGDPKDSTWYFVTLVPLDRPGLSIEWITNEPAGHQSQEDRSHWRWVVASSDLDQPCAQELKTDIERGMHLLWVLDRPVQIGQQSQRNADPVAIEKIWQSWFPEDSIQVSESPTGRFHLLQDIDMSHPVFAPFADPKFNDFTKIRFWRHRRIEGFSQTDWKTVAKFDDGSPFLMQRPLGKGSVSILASGWQPAESQLALSSKFVPMIWSMFEQGNSIRLSPEFRCGDEVPDLIAKRVWMNPRGTTLETPPPKTLNRFGEPGIFKATETEEFMAVNLSRSEGLTDPMDLGEFDRFGVPIDRRNPKELDRIEALKTNQLAEQLEANQSVWWWTLLGVLLFAGLESIIAALRRQNREPRVAI